VFEGLLPLHDAFEDFVANADVREVDDCFARVVSHSCQISHELWNAEQAGFKESAVRTGVQMTVWVASKEGLTLRWFRVGREHQGERESVIQSKRTEEGPVIRASDAASKASAIKPFPALNAHGFVPTGSSKVASDSQAETAYCWEHLRQTFEKASPGFRKEVDLWMRDIVSIFENEAECRDLSPQGRLKFHQNKSLAIVDVMKTRAQHELANNIKAEPNGAYAKAMRYFLNNFDGLSLFLKRPGVPLTTTLAESAAKFTKKHHKNSLSFQTQKGGDAGAFFMSLIATCLGLKVNPLEYLSALIEWRHEISKENAKEWFPNNFREKRAEVESRYGQAQGGQPYRVCKKRTKAPDKDWDTSDQASNPQQQTSTVVVKESKNNLSQKAH
jgi:hypothetical protein